MTGASIVEIKEVLDESVQVAYPLVCIREELLGTLEGYIDGLIRIDDYAQYLSDMHELDEE
jgi:hypothetical protein